MTRKEFWEHIRASRRVDPEAHQERLTKRLAKLPVPDILDFDHWWDVALAEAYHWNLWGAAYLINGGCSDDGFEYFREWLILQGRELFEAAVKHPDSLSDVVDADEDCYECEGRPAWYAWFAATKTEQDEAGYDMLLAALNKRHPKKLKARGMGRRWNFDDDAAVRKRFPRLAAMYLGNNAEGDEDD
jgi:hypothetical protein